MLTGAATVAAAMTVMIQQNCQKQGQHMEAEARLKKKENGKYGTLEFKKDS